jgi:hypothetical protein
VARPVVECGLERCASLVKEQDITTLGLKRLHLSSRRPEIREDNQESIVGEPKQHRRPLHAV